MLFCDTNYAKWCKNWLVRKNPPKVTIYNENGLLVCRATTGQGHKSRQRVFRTKSKMAAVAIFCHAL